MSSNSEKYKALVDLYTGAYPSKSKVAIQKDVNELWILLRKNSVEYDAKMIELQDRKNMHTSRSLQFWSQLPKGIAKLKF